MGNKSGRIVSKKASARAKRAYASSGIKKWADAVKAARKALGVTGFVAINAAMALPMKKVAMKKAAMKSAAMKKAGAGAMKRVMKAKKVSKIAKGKHAGASVFSGRKEKTLSGMTKDKLTKNKSGRIVSKKAS